jgi:hypothetical protein
MKTPSKDKHQAPATSKTLELWERWQASGFSWLSMQDARAVVARLGASKQTQKRTVA